MVLRQLRDVDDVLDRDGLVEGVADEGEGPLAANVTACMSVCLCVWPYVRTKHAPPPETPRAASLLTPRYDYEYLYIAITLHIIIISNIRITSY